MDNFDQKYLGTGSDLDRLKMALQKQQKIVMNYKLMIDQLEKYPRKLDTLKETIRVSRFYSESGSKDDLLALTDSLKIEKVNNKEIVFSIEEKRKARKVIFKCSFDLQDVLKVEQPKITIENSDDSIEIELEDGYGSLRQLLDFNLQITEYLTVIFAVFYLFDTNNLLDYYEPSLDDYSELHQVLQNITMICHTRKKRKLQHNIIKDNKKRGSIHPLSNSV
jgi:hypothetical protein